jgi:hypothetical protein
MTAKSSRPIENKLVIRAKSRVARWFDVVERNAGVRPKLLKGIESVARVLPNRADWYEVITIRLDDSADLPIHIETPRYRAFPCMGCLAMTTVVPGWNFGWGDILKDEDVHQILSWFLHYARQICS